MCKKAHVIDYRSLLCATLAECIRPSETGFSCCYTFASGISPTDSMSPINSYAEFPAQLCPEMAPRRRDWLCSANPLAWGRGRGLHLSYYCETMERLAEVAKGYACSQALPHYHPASCFLADGGEQATLPEHSELPQAPKQRS